MSMATFKAALSLASEDGSMLTIGGGEPTLHPHCMDFVWMAVRATLQNSFHAGMSIVGLVTNGSVPKRALEIAAMARAGLVSARLSYDKFHNVKMVRKDVLRAFQAEQIESDWGPPRKKDERDLRTINRWEYFVAPHGRALDNNMGDHPTIKKDSCFCEGIFITPDGRIWQCGCCEKQIGHTSDLKAFYVKYNELLDNDNEVPCSKKPVDSNKKT